MKVVSSFTLGIIAVVILFVGFGMFLPSGYQTNAEVLIQAKPSDVYPMIDQLSNWEKWAFDPSDSVSRLNPLYQGAESGEGAIHVWEDASGSKGRLEIIRSEPYEEIVTKIITNDGVYESESKFLFKEVNNGTRVQWKESGEFGWNLSARYYAFAADFEDQVSEKYQQSLLKLKEIIENQETKE